MLQVVQRLFCAAPSAQDHKVMRMHAQTAMIENGLVHLPKEAAWLAEYLPFAIPVGIGSVGWRAGV